MECKEKYLAKHKSQKTEMKMFLTSGAMLTGPVTDFDDYTVVLGECIANWDHICSLTPKTTKG